MDNKSSQIAPTQSRPLISVIVPVYNVAKYMDRCMKTVCGQTYKNLEILVIDDGSTDGSSALCDKWAAADSRIRLIRQPNQGLSAARNTALDVATGEWIAFVDSDDWIERDMYEGLCRVAVENDADIVACGHIREYSKKSKVRSVSDIVKTVTPDEALKMVVEDRHLQNHVWSKIYRRRLFNEVRFPVGEIYEDSTAKGKCRTENDGIADESRSSLSLIKIIGDFRRNSRLANRLAKFLEHLSVLCALDRLRACTEKLRAALLKNTFLLKLHSKVKTCLSTDTGENRVGTLIAKDLGNIFKGKRLHVNLIRNSGVGHNGSRVGVYENYLVALLLKCKTSLCTL